VSVAVTYDPGQMPALVCGLLAIAGLLLSFFVRRRRMFVRAVPAASADGFCRHRRRSYQVRRKRRFEDEFASLSAELSGNNQSETGA